MRSSSSLAIASLAAFLAALTSACTSGGGGGCSLNGGTTLANACQTAEETGCAPWPKFRRDAANTGRTPVQVVSEPGNAIPLFGEVGSIAATPILGDGRILIASSDGNVYVTDYEGNEIALEDQIDTFGAISASPLLGQDGTIFVASGDGSLIQYESNGNARRSTGIGGFLSASPNIGGDGTIYLASTLGTFSGVCPNGRFKFQLGITSSESSAAVTEDPREEKDRIIVFAHQNGEVRSTDIRGRQRWSFFASPAGVSAAVVLDLASETVFVGDLEGRVFAVDLFDGSRRASFAFRADARISASLALGRDGGESSTLYVADERGALHAVDRSTGMARWTPPFDTGGTIRSSPAVSTSGDRDVVVVAADVEGSQCGTDDDGNPLSACAIVYAIADMGSAPEVLWSRTIAALVGTSSPSIGADGTVYIGAQDGVLYKIARG